MKYLELLLEGHIPTWGPRVNKDVEPFIRFFMPKTQEATRPAMKRVCSHFHLALKGMKGDEVYEVLMLQLLKAINRYDPAYTDKVKLVTEVISTLIEDAPLKQFDFPDFRDHMDFDCYRHLRMLARHRFIEQVLEDGQPAGWVICSANWPPPKSFHRAGPIGLAYYLQTWFRYNLREWSYHSLMTRFRKAGTSALFGTWEFARA